MGNTNTISRYGLREECGVVGAFSFSGEDVSAILYRALFSLQHRGQDSAGMAVFSKDSGIKLYRKLGLVSSIFSQEVLESLKGHCGIAHVRYPTIGAGGEEDTQPFLTKSPRNGIALAHNGNIANYGSMKKRLEQQGVKLSSTCDADLILAEFSRHMKEHDEDIFISASMLMKELDGSYSVCAITGNAELIVFRDPNAMRPLVWGRSESTILFASESVALDINNIPLSGDIKPGEVLVVDKSGATSKVVVENTRKRHCMFEYVYFSRPDSIIEKKLVWNVRHKLGQFLAREFPVKADIVVAVPDTSRPAAEGYANAAKIPLVEGLMKNRYIGRTFIMPSQDKRKAAVRFKLNPVKPLVQGKKVVLIDDSIVRGTTAGPIVELLRDAGAKEVHMRITCPPITNPCFYGVDLPTYSELVAANKSVKEIEKLIGADSLHYLSIESLVKAIGMERESLCLGCLTGDYPTDAGKRISDLMKKQGDSSGVRIWEEKAI